MPIFAKKGADLQALARQRYAEGHQVFTHDHGLRDLADDIELVEAEGWTLAHVGGGGLPQNPGAQWVLVYRRAQ